MGIKDKKTQKALLRHRMRDRFLARLMAVMMAVTMMPLQSLPVHAEHITTVKSIKEIKDSYTVENGTSKEDIGLPDKLSVVLETREEGSEGQEDKVSRVNVKKEVTWEGSYDGDTAGTYKLEAAFEDD